MMLGLDVGDSPSTRRIGLMSLDERLRSAVRDDNRIESNPPQLVERVMR
jgi:hypothetical protein